jgi:ERF superfamily protein
MRELTANVPTEPATLNLWEKLSLVARQCSYVQKDGVNQFHKYNYATAASVYEKVNLALADSGLVSVPHMEIHALDLRTNAKGSQETLATVKCTVQVIDVDSGESLSTSAYGSGMDNGDKAIMKAQTAAMKYAWMDLLNISTGDDPEADHSVDTRVTGEKMPKAPPRGQATGDFTAADKELARQAKVDQRPAIEQIHEISARAAAKFGQKCKLCDGPIGSYTSKAGVEYEQCMKAHDNFMEGRKMGMDEAQLKQLGKGHTYMKKSVAELSQGFNEATR